MGLTGAGRGLRVQGLVGFVVYGYDVPGPGPPKCLLIEPLWPLIVGISSILEGSWGGSREGMAWVSW